MAPAALLVFGAVRMLPLLEVDGPAVGLKRSCWIEASLSACLSSDCSGLTGPQSGPLMKDIAAKEPENG